MTKIWEFPCGEAFEAETAEQAAAELFERNEDEVYDPTKAKMSVVRDTNDFEAEFGIRKHRAKGTESNASDWYETFGKDLMKVLARANHKDPAIQKTVWTVVEGDNNLTYLIPGYHLVNRLQYVISKKPWKTGKEEFLW
jgi:hypothetical protein